MVTRKKKVVRKAEPRKKTSNWLAPYIRFLYSILIYFH